jgi:hypothetical protein
LSPRIIFERHQKQQDAAGNLEGADRHIHLPQHHRAAEDEEDENRESDQHRIERDSALRARIERRGDRQEHRQRRDRIDDQEEGDELVEVLLPPHGFCLTSAGRM